MRWTNQYSWARSGMSPRLRTTLLVVAIVVVVVVVVVTVVILAMVGYQLALCDDAA